MLQSFDSLQRKRGIKQAQLGGGNLQAVIGLTDSSAASRYQVVQASLLNPAGKYVTPTTGALAAAAAAMSASATQKQVVSFDPTSSAAKSSAAAYPLAVPIYAAVNPLMADADVRKDYASFITYAASDGQTAGTGDGQLPDGYAPIPASWKTEALAAAAGIAAGTPVATATPSPAASASAAKTTAAPATSSTSAATQQTASGSAATTTVADPSADGATAPALSSGKTADDPSVPAMVAVVPVSAAAALAAALAIPPLTRRRRL